MEVLVGVPIFSSWTSPAFSPTKQNKPHLSSWIGTSNPISFPSILCLVAEKMYEESKPQMDVLIGFLIFVSWTSPAFSPTKQINPICFHGLELLICNNLIDEDSDSIRAKKHGWQDTYVFTKAMGEMVIDQMRGEIPVVIIRPSVIESTCREPFPGWMEGNRFFISYQSRIHYHPLVESNYHLFNFLPLSGWWIP